LNLSAQILLKVAMTASSQIDVVSIGNAIVDIMCRCDDAFLVRMGLSKGQLHPVGSSSEMSRLLGHFPRRVEVAGGSASNVAVGVASFGGVSTFIGKVFDDSFGRLFRHDMRGAGVDVRSGVAVDPDAETSRSLILISPDGQRTMLTFLGQHMDLDPDLIDQTTVRNAKCLFIEGYLLDTSTSRAACRRAVSLAAGSGRLAVLALSDPNCVARNRAEFRRLLASGIGLLIASEAEVTSLYETKNFDVAAGLVAKDIRRAVLTRGAKGCIVVADGKSLVVPAQSVSRVVDATGAGDMFAAGVVFGLSHGMSLDQSARLGCFAAAEIISQVSARPEVRLLHSAVLRGLLGNAH
jgi:sugar/nucleoside kinase (ribokinase family)